MSTALQNTRIRNRSRQQHAPGRGGYASAVHYRRETPEPEPPQPSQTSQSSGSPVRGIYSDPRTVMILCSFVGTQTTVKTRNGDRYKGHTVSFSEKGDIAMIDVKADDEHTKNPKQPGLIITKEDFVVCKTNGVDFKGLFTSSDFTDSGIASRMNGSTETSMKELQPWQDDDLPETNSSFLEECDGWDSTSMFQANRDKFNVQSTYNEDLLDYTTKLPDPSSEGYEEKEKFAQRHAEAIERSEVYQARIAKELKDGDEEALFSAVHRGNEPGAHSSRHQETNSGSGKNNYVAPALREDGEQSMRNDGYRTQGRGPPHSAGHSQQPPQHPHQNMQQAARQMNNQFHSSPPTGGPMNRNQGPSSLHQRPQNHAAHLHHPPQQYQQPPPLHPGMQQHAPPGVVSQHHQQQRPPPHHHQQPVSPSQHPGKPHPPHSYSQNAPPTSSPLPSQSHQLPPQTQHPPPQKLGPQYKQPPIQQSASIRGASVNGPLGPPPVTQDIRQTVPLQTNKEAEKCAEVSSPTTPQVESQQVYHQKPPVLGPPPASGSAGGQKVPEAHISASSSSSSLVDVQQVGSYPVPAATQVAPAPDRRVGRGAETSPEERNKIGQSLHDFQKNFILESNGGASQEPVRQDGIIDSSAVSTSPTTSNVGTTTTAATAAPEASSQPTEQAAEVLAKAESLEESQTSQKSKLNPNAKEFKPKTQTVQPVQIETQSPSPQPRSSPHMPQMVHYSPQQTVLVPYNYIMANPLANAQRKRATVSLGAGVDLAAHQVTGQPLLATQPHSMMYLQPAGQGLPAAYQFYSSQMISPRMMAPGSLTMAQAGQVAGMEQAASQHQPQPVFITTQQQPLHTPMPAHLHPQPAHAQAISLPPASQQAQPAHVPNPVPSPVQHQQQNSQQMPHHISQGPPQSATPQPPHYPQMTVNYTHGMPAVSRSSMPGQQNMAAGHSSVNFISAPQFQYNGGAAQYTFAPAPQPQTSQNSSHGPGPQPQYVIMPQPSAPAHPPIQQHTAQPYTGTGIPFQPQQHFMQGPPHMPPNHAQNPGQSSSHLMHPGMAANLHQQVSGNQPNMYMQVQYQHQQ